MSLNVLWRHFNANVHGYIQTHRACVHNKSD